MNITIIDPATRVVQQLRATIAAAPLHAAIATKVKQHVQDHLLAKGPNKKGWPSTSFYPGAAHATSATSDGTHVTVTIDQVGIRQRYYGGPIAPVNAKALTIPIDPLSYGHRASEFPNLSVVKTPKGVYLVQKTQRAHSKVRAASTRAQAAPRFLFKLVGSVNQAPDSTVLPSKADLLATAVAEVNRNIATATR